MRIFRRDNGPKDGAQSARPWAVSACSQLLFLQALGLLFLTWLQAPKTVVSSFANSWLAVLLFFLSMYALLASVNFLRMHAAARNRATLIQGFSLLLGIVLYWAERPVFIYPLMAYSIFIVLYLQHPDVREFFEAGAQEG